MGLWALHPCAFVEFSGFLLVVVVIVIVVGVFGGYGIICVGMGVGKGTVSVRLVTLRVGGQELGGVKRRGEKEGKEKEGEKIQVSPVPGKGPFPPS